MEKSTQVNKLHPKNPGHDLDKTSFQPVRIGEIEISKPLPTFPTLFGNSDRRYKQARILVRLFSYPLGLVDVSLEREINPDYLANLIWQELHQPITACLKRFGGSQIKQLSAEGISSVEYERFLVEQKQLLKKTPFVSVIVCTRDRCEQLATCLSRLSTLEYSNYEIIVVDNAPKTTLIAELIREKYGSVQNIRYCCEEHPGLSWARNCGLNNTDAEIVAYIDDDTVPDSRWLIELVKGFQHEENVGCVTGMILPAKLETQAQDWFEQYGGHSKGRGFDQLTFNKESLNNQSPLFPNPPYGAGANMAFKTSILRELGGFDLALGAGTNTKGGEDTASFYDILMQGYTLVYNPAAFVYHFHRRSYVELSNQFYGYGLGLTAFYTRCLLKDPKTLFEIICLFPRGIALFFRRRIIQTENPGYSFPSALIRTKIRGMISGPWAYLKSLQNLSWMIKNDGTQNRKNLRLDQ